MDDIRLQKYIAETGTASRRKAEELIKKGLVRVNGITVTEMGQKVSNNDKVEVDGKVVKPEDKKVYIMLNKPSGYVTTSKDQFSRPTVIDLVKDLNFRLYPVGRLDYDTSGLLLLSNDGEFTYRITHPKHNIKKAYVAEINGILNSSELEMLKSGIELDDFKTSPAEIKILEKRPDTSLVEITIHEGKNRQVRRMLEITGHIVIKLKRSAIGKLQLGNLKEGCWRLLDKRELDLIIKS